MIFAKQWRVKNGVAMECSSKSLLAFKVIKNDTIYCELLKIRVIDVFSDKSNISKNSNHPTERCFTGNMSKNRYFQIRKLTQQN